jgi:hypothetical protein
VQKKPTFPRLLKEPPYIFRTQANIAFLSNQQRNLSNSPGASHYFTLQAHARTRTTAISPLKLGRSHNQTQTS